MAQRGQHRQSWWIAALVAGLVGIAGCGKKEPPAVTGTEPAKEPTSATPPTAATALATPSLFGGNDRLHQSFASAARGDDNPPDDADRPPDMTATGKPTFALLKQVKALWETIRFTTEDGKAIAYTAVVETDLGTIEIALNPDAAPNHVRSFVALAMAGFYDGLPFDHVRVEDSVKTDGSVDTRLELVEAGNPCGMEAINGTIGYWLPLEPSKALIHEEGTVGACLEGGEATDGCRFYITLTRAPYLDGSYSAFGKVKTGLDVARSIFTQPVAAEDQDHDGLRRPERPVVIRKVTIQTRVVGAAEGL